MEKRIKVIIISLMLISTLLMAGCNEADPDKVLSDSDKTEIKKMLLIWTAKWISYYSHQNPAVSVALRLKLL